ncbi:hypothetical protein CHUAL_010763 [Chamberlinius hualienensis]
MAITSLNLNHCHWMSYDSLKLVMELPNLKHLHVIDCDFKQLLNNNIYPKKLQSLSFRWDNELESSINFKQQIKNLKSVSICVTNVYRLSAIAYICYFLFKNCPKLVRLHLYSPPAYINNDVMRYVNEHIVKIKNLIAKGKVPKLTELHLDVDVNFKEKPLYLDFVKLLLTNFRDLRKVNLGNLSSDFYEFNEELSSKLVPMVSNKTTIEICLDGYHNFYVDDMRWVSKKISKIQHLPEAPLVWKYQKTPNCVKVSIKNLAYANLHSTVLIMANACPLLQELDLSGCKVSIIELQSGLKAIVKKCPKLVNLNLTIEPLIDENEDNYSEIANSIGSLKELRILHISTTLITVDVNKNKKCRHHNLLAKNQTELNEYEEPLMTIVKNCTKIEEFYLSGVTSCVNRIDYGGGCLCYISLWSKLKKTSLNQSGNKWKFLDKSF